MGFSIAKRPFEFSALPGRYGAPIVGGVVALMLVITGEIGVVGTRLQLLTTLTGTIALVTGLADLLGGRRGVRLPLMRVRATNLEAVRGVDPRVWLVAHIDSKSQPISTAVRTLAVVLLGCALVLAAGLAVASIWWRDPTPFRVVQFLALAGGGLLLFAVVGSMSDGAADNASGVASVLDAAALLPGNLPVGVLITDGEELALAGARAWARERPPRIAINCDTIDDAGRFVVMRYANSQGLARQTIEVATRVDPRAMLISPLPGVLTDSVAFREARWDTVTLSRGTVRTLNRIHTVRDTLPSMRGTGIPDAARILARLVEELS